MNANPRTDTFLFTDLENSTPLWENHPGLMQELAARHDALMRKVIEEHRGRVVKTTGDGFHAAFDAATDGVAAALAGQQAMVGEFWPAETGPLRVRMGLHTGESRPRDGDFYGSEVNRAARVMGLAYGGQVLVSGATARLVRNTLPAEVSLFDLGRHRLKGLASAERVYQVQHPTLPTEFPPLKSLSAYKHNLPVQLSTFVGREREVAEVKRLLQECHLLTLLGPGGTGKTRLMLEVAEEVIGDFTHGVWLVELAPLTDPDLIPERVAAALSIQEQPDRAMSETLVDYLRRKETLLLLDNVEHLIQECAELAQHLLTHCPKLKILVTGREALFIAGETTLQIPSLSLPSGNGDSNLEEIRASEGVQLFVARAQDIHPDFELGPANAATIAEIVRRLDGIPLALELATARLRMLSVEQIAERLDDRFRLLTGGRRTALPRQQTLQAMIDWSWNLLDEKERLLLQRLSVFSGGWTLKAAQAVAGSDQAGYNRLDEYDVFDLLEQLVNKSLVTVQYPAEGAARFGMLESIRQYGRDRLFESNEGSSLRDRHADYFVAFAEEAGPHLYQATMLEWTARIKLELDNLRAVLAWTIEDHPELALRIGGSLLYYESHWLTPREARSWLEPAIERTRGLLDEEETRVRTVDFIKAMIGLMSANGIQGRYSVALPLAEEIIQLARDSGESRHVAYTIAIKHLAHPFNMTREEMQELEEAIAIIREKGFDVELVLALVVYGMALDAQGKSDLATSHFQEAVEISRRGDRLFDTFIFFVLTRLARSQGNLDEVKTDILSTLEDYEALNHRRGIAMGQSAMAHLLREEGNLEEAEIHYRQSIVGWQELGHRSAVAHQLECFAYMAIAKGRYEHAARLLGTAKETREQLNALSEDPQEIEELAQAMEQLAGAMGEDERDKALAVGSLIDLDEAVQIALTEIT
jgi:predicted ATPase/class 3 adenylate cyclase